MRTKWILLSLLLGFFSVACIDAQTPVIKKKVLVAYFSHSGNTRVIAEYIQKATGADIFEIKPVNVYPTDYNVLVEQAQKEVDAKYKPALQTQVNNIAKYDVIFIGSPNWWSTIAPPVATFLSTYNLEGKMIVPFITHEGSALGRSVTDMRQMCPKSNIVEGLAIRGSDVKEANADVLKWLQKLELMR